MHRHCDSTSLLCQFREPVEQRQLMRRVEAGRRFVGQQDRSVLGQNARQQYAGKLAA